MAETAPEPGRLEVRTRALQHIVEQVAMDNPATVARRATLGGVRGANYPHASVSLVGGRARVALDVACTWPTPITRVAAEVREHVRVRAHELSGIEVVSVDVTVATVSSVSSEPGRSAEGRVV